MEMNQYHNLVRKVMEQGEHRADRTGVGTISLFGEQIRFNLMDGFPLLTTKRVPFKAVLHELLWFISGSTNVRDLQKHGVTIWDEWADEETGELGPIYGKQWRRWFSARKLLSPGPSVATHIDQLAGVIDGIRKNPMGRRHIVTAWNPDDVDQMALPPCHCFFQFYVAEGKYLDCQLYQRSADLFLGVPFNIASYALLTKMVAQVTGLFPRNFIHTFGDVHVYHNHIDQVAEMLSREERNLPAVSINPARTEIDQFVFEDFNLIGYDPHPAIKAPVAV